MLKPKGWAAALIALIAILGVLAIVSLGRAVYPFLQGGTNKLPKLSKAEHDNYYQQIDQIVESGTAEDCLRLPAGEIRYDEQIAPNYSEETKESLQGRCVHNLVSAKPSEAVCIQYREFASVDAEVDACFLDAAIYQKDEALCKYIEGDYWFQECLKAFK